MLYEILADIGRINVAVADPHISVISEKQVIVLVDHCFYVPCLDSGQDSFVDLVGLALPGAQTNGRHLSTRVPNWNLYITIPLLY